MGKLYLTANDITFFTLNETSPNFVVELFNVYSCHVIYAGRAAPLIMVYPRVIIYRTIFVQSVTLLSSAQGRVRLSSGRRGSMGPLMKHLLMTLVNFSEGGA